MYKNMHIYCIITERCVIFGISGLGYGLAFFLVHTCLLACFNYLDVCMKQLFTAIAMTIKRWTFLA